MTLHMLYRSLCKVCWDIYCCGTDNFVSVNNTWEVTNCTARRMQEPNFCHGSFENLAKMRQARQDAVGLCQKIVTLT